MILAGEVLVNGAAAAKAGNRLREMLSLRFTAGFRSTSAGADSSWKEHCRISPSLRMERFVWTWVRRMAGSRIACCSTVQAAFTQ